MEYKEWKGMSDHGMKRNDVSMINLFFGPLLKEFLNPQPQNLEGQNLGL